MGPQNTFSHGWQDVLQPAQADVTRVKFDMLSTLHAASLLDEMSEQWDGMQSPGWDVWNSAGQADGYPMDGKIEPTLTPPIVTRAATPS